MIIFINNIDRLKGAFALPLTEKPLSISDVSGAIKAVNKANPRLTIQPKTKFSDETDRFLNPIRVENENIEAYYGDIEPNLSMLGKELIKKVKGILKFDPLNNSKTRIYADKDWTVDTDKLLDKWEAKLLTNSTRK